MTLEESIKEAVLEAVAPVLEQMRAQAEELRQLRRVLPPAFGSKQDAARLLGVSVKSIGRGIARGEIEVKRIGTRVLVDLAKLHVDDQDDEMAGRRMGGVRR